jgi:hypothetical protein
MRSLISSLLLGVAVVSALLGCAMPLCALGASAAFLVPRKNAFAIVGIGWLLNQVLGFTVHAYPRTGATLAWGVAIGVAAIAATYVASLVAQRGHDVLNAAFALAASFAGFEIVLVLASIRLGGWGAYEPSIIMQLFAVNALWFACTVGAVVAIQRFRHEPIA